MIGIGRVKLPARKVLQQLRSVRRQVVVCLHIVLTLLCMRAANSISGRKSPSSQKKSSTAAWASAGS